MIKLTSNAWVIAGLALAMNANAGELHVAPRGDNSNPGTAAAPLRTIQHAADLAQPGDTVTVHEGVYRERVNPPRGGTSDAERIVYQVAPGEKVEIKGSEVVKGWVKQRDDVWKVTLPDSFFGDFNPYKDLIRGDWFNPKGREHHTGAVYLNGEWLIEAATLDEVMKPVDQTPLWFGKVEGDSTTLWAQFKGIDPNEHGVEINVRRTVFYPDQPGRNFITVRGFTMRHAATPWAPPTAEQIGLIGTHWSKGWIIEDNIISHSVCSGISLGKHGDEFDNTSANSAGGYVKTIERAHAHPITWSKENIGHHLVRNNTISHCEQAGIVGSLGCAFSTITGNHIHDIHVRRVFKGVEMAGIKFHGAIDTEITGNHIHHTKGGLWLDWMAQGTRVSRNLMHDNSDEDLFVEVNHGPFLVDHNILLSSRSLWDMSEGGAYAHNLLAGRAETYFDMDRLVPHMRPHSAAIAGSTITQGGDNRFFNNIFVGQGLPDDKPALNSDPRARIVGSGLWIYNTRPYPLQTGGNVYLNGARPYKNESDALVLEQMVKAPLLEWKSGQMLLHFSMLPELEKTLTRLVATKTLGRARVSDLSYENADGTPLTVDTDFFGKPRSDTNPTPGPFEQPESGAITLTDSTGKLLTESLAMPNSTHRPCPRSPGQTN